MIVYHALLKCKGLFIKTDRQPSGGGVLTSPYIHDFTLHYAFYQAFQYRPISLPGNPSYLEEIKQHFQQFPVYVFPTVITNGIQKTETVHPVANTRSIPGRESGINAPNLNIWLGYKQFITETTIFSNILLPERFYIRLGKKRAPIEIILIKVQHKFFEGEQDVRLISPIILSKIEYTQGTLIKMNPTPLYLGKIKSRLIFYEITNEIKDKLRNENILYEFKDDIVFKPIQFEFFQFQ